VRQASLAMTGPVRRRRRRRPEEASRLPLPKARKSHKTSPHLFLLGQKLQAVPLASNEVAPAESRAGRFAFWAQGVGH